jgi:hypothetical protein
VDYYEDYNSIAPSKVRECWTVFYAKRFHIESYKLVRSSGNIIRSEALIDLHLSNALQLQTVTLASVDSVHILAGGIAAVAVFTADQRFFYLGTENHDRTVYTVVVEETMNGEPKIVHEHRTTGQPIPKYSRWRSNSIGSDDHRGASLRLAQPSPSQRRSAAVIPPVDEEIQSSSSTSNASSKVEMQDARWSSGSEHAVRRTDRSPVDERLLRLSFESQNLSSM